MSIYADRYASNLSMQPLSYNDDDKASHSALQAASVPAMRVATYTESSAATGSSMFELSILLSAILLGLGVVPTVATFYSGPLAQLMTPIWILLYVGSFLGLMFRHGINWITWLVRYRILLVVLLLGTIASVFWSINTQLSAERVVHLVGSSLIAVYIGFSLPLLITLRVFAIVLALSLLASVAAAVGIPELGIEAYEGTRVWKGVFNSKNDLGFWAGVGVLLYVTLSHSLQSVSAKLLCLFMVLVSLGVLVLSHSATSLVAMLVAGSLALYLYIANRFQLSFFRMAFIAVLFIALTVLLIANIETNELVGRSGDLTGRGEVWGQVINLIFEHPLKGVGYGSLWFPTDSSIWAQQSFFDFTWVVYHAHNGLLQIASEVGIPLALISVLMVTQQLIEIFYCQYERRQAGVLFVLSFVIAFLVSNYSEARFLVSRELFWIFFLALPICMLRQINESSADAPEGVGSKVNPATGGWNPGAHQHTYSRTPDARSAVSDKPWLDALPDQSVPAGAGLLAGPSSSQMGTNAGHAGEELAGDMNLTASSLSLTETDIDLGGMVDESPYESQPDDAMDRSGSPSSEYVPAEKVVPTKTAREPDTFDNNDTFDVDRYEFDLDLSGDWTNINIDIDLDDGK